MTGTPETAGGGGGGGCGGVDVETARTLWRSEMEKKEYWLFVKSRKPAQMNKNDSAKRKGYFRSLKMLSTEIAIPFGDSEAQERDRIIQSNLRK